jgi:hypothetical protein
MGVAISSIGLATAQGGTADISYNLTLLAAKEWPWPVNSWSTSQRCYPAVGVSSSLNGIQRWQALIQLALKDCFRDHSPSPEIPIFIGSCNGSAGDSSAGSWSKAFESAALLEGTAWAGQCWPVFSSSCSSGLHALYAAGQVLMSGQADEVVVLAADILSRSNRENFEVLRVLTDSPMRPWQPTSTGFLLGEAAVVLRLVREKSVEAPTCLIGPVLANELTRDDGLPRVLRPLSTANPQLLLGQGTGPFVNDQSELAAFQNFVEREVPLATSLVHFGHTLGASGLLAIALAALIQQTPRALSTLVMPTAYASDGRPMNRGTTIGNGVGNNAQEISNVLVSCRALNGSCAAAVVGKTDGSQVLEDRRQNRQPEKVWQPSIPTGPLMSTLLRRLADEAPRHRPIDPPDVLVVRLEEPLAPPPEASIGGRLLPSAVLEITPGFVSQLIARCWGFAGPALCLVGHIGNNEATWDLAAAFDDPGLVIAQIDLRGTGDKREIAWSN